MRLTITLLTKCLLACSSPLFGQIVNIENQRDHFTDSVGFHEQLDISVAFIKNTKSIININGGLQVEFGLEGRMFLSLTQLNFQRAGGEEFVNEGFQHLRYTVQWSPRTFYEVFGQIQYNEAILIKLRGLAGTGPRFALLRGDQSKVFFGTSLMFEYNELSGDEVIHRNLRWGNYGSLTLKPNDKWSVTSTTYYQPLFSNFADYRLSSETVIRLKISEKVLFRSALQLRYDSRRPGGVPNLISRFTNGITIRN